MKADGANPPGQSIYGLIDLNCHILPGIGDGPRNMTEAIKMLHIAYDEGVRTIVATLRYGNKDALTDTDRLDRLIEQLNTEAVKIDQDFQVYLGCEIAYSGDSHEKIIMGMLESMADSKYVMLKFDYDTAFDYMAEAIRDVNMDGYIPIVADVERYACLDEDEEKVEALIQLGAYIQVSAGAVTGDLGHDVKNFVKRLLKNQLVHFVATGASDSDEQAPYIKECAEYIERKYGYEYMKELLFTNPKAVIENDDIDI